MARGLNVFVSIGAKIGAGFGSTVSGVERRFDQMARHVKLRSAEMKAAMRGMRNDLSTFGTNVSMPAGLAAGAGARFVYEWSKVGNELQAVTQMSAEARKEIEMVARGLPGNPAQNLSAALDLARTGFTSEQIKATLATTIKLSRADSSVDQASAADIMTNVMKGMKMPDGTFKETVASAERVANNLAFASAQSSSDVRLMGESFKYAGPMAARLGIPIESLSGYFMTMADNGIKGSEAGVALRSGMVRLLKPTKDANAILAKYNMNLGDYVSLKEKLTGESLARQLAAGGFKASAKELQSALDSGLDGGALVQRISEVVAQGLGDGANGADLDVIATAVTNALMGGVDKMDFTKFVKDGVAKGWNAGDFARFFDVRQGTRLSTLFGPDMVKNIERVEAAMRGMSGGGSFLDKMYAMQMQGAVGPWERLKQSFGNLFIAMAESGAMDTIANAMDRVAAAVMEISKSSPTTLKIITFALLGLAALAPLGFVLAGIGAGLKIVWLALGPVARGLMWLLGRGVPMLLNGLTRVAPLLLRGLIALFSGPLGWIALAAGLIWYFWPEIKKGWEAVKGWFTNTAWPALGRTAAAVRDWGIMIVENIKSGIASAWEGLKGWFKGKWNELAPGLLKFGAAAAAGPAGLAVLGGNMATKAIAGRARGGSVSAGTTYEWHERGREYFVPGRSGTVIDAATVAAMNRYRGGGGGLSIGQIVVQAANDPHATALAVRAEIQRMAAGQAALLSD